MSHQRGDRLLLGHEAFRSTTPIQLFNKATDPFLPAVKPHLFQVLHALDEPRPGQPSPGHHPVQGHRTADMASPRIAAARAGHATVHLLRHHRPQGRADRQEQDHHYLHRTVARTGERTKVVLYWRPIVPGWNDQPETMAHVLDARQGRRRDRVHRRTTTSPQTPPTSAASASRFPTSRSTPAQGPARRPRRPRDRRLARLGHQHPAVPQDLLRRLRRPRGGRLQRPLGRPGAVRHLPRQARPPGAAPPTPSRQATSSRQSWTGSDTAATT